MSKKPRLMVTYYSMVWRRAIAETSSHATRNSLFVGLGIAVLGFAVSKVEDRSVPLGHNLLTAGIAVLIWLVGYFLCQLFYAPVRINKEARDELAIVTGRPDRQPPAARTSAAPIGYTEAVKRVQQRVREGTDLVGQLDAAETTDAVVALYPGLLGWEQQAKDDMAAFHTKWAQAFAVGTSFDQVSPNDRDGLIGCLDRKLAALHKCIDLPYSPFKRPVNRPPVMVDLVDFISRLRAGMETRKPLQREELELLTDQAIRWLRDAGFPEPALDLQLYKERHRNDAMREEGVERRLVAVLNRETT